MPMKPVLIAVAASGAAFYALGRYGHDLSWPGAPSPAVQQAMAQAETQTEPPQAASAGPSETELAQAPAAPGRPAMPPAQAQKVDETALRYFAAQGDTRRYDAELARLRALYPEWKPPTDLASPVPAGDAELERLWKLFADGKLGEARAAIAQRSSADPNWQAPADLITQLDRAEAGQRLANASNAKQWEQVIRIGTETPALLTCANVDALWRVTKTV